MSYSNCGFMLYVLFSAGGVIGDGVKLAGVRRVSADSSKGWGGGWYSHWSPLASVWTS